MRCRWRLRLAARVGVGNVPKLWVASILALERRQRWVLWGGLAVLLLLLRLSLLAHRPKRGQAWGLSLLLLLLASGGLLSLGLLLRGQVVGGGVGRIWMVPRIKLVAIHIGGGGGASEWNSGKRWGLGDSEVVRVLDLSSDARQLLSRRRLWK